MGKSISQHHYGTLSSLRRGVYPALAPMATRCSWRIRVPESGVPSSTQYIRARPAIIVFLSPSRGFNRGNIVNHRNRLSRFLHIDTGKIGAASIASFDKHGRHFIEKMVGDFRIGLIAMKAALLPVAPPFMQTQRTHQCAHYGHWTAIT